jgi:hypothetical protein
MTFPLGRESAKEPTKAASRTYDNTKKSLSNEVDKAMQLRLLAMRYLRATKKIAPP